MCKNTRFGIELDARVPSLEHSTTDDLISRTMFTNPDLGHNIQHMKIDKIDKIRNPNKNIQWWFNIWFSQWATLITCLMFL